MVRYVIVAILLSSSVLAATPAGPTAEDEGHAARLQWEAWFASQPADKQAGAKFWADARSKTKPPACAAVAGSDGAFLSGCLQAQIMLAPMDVRRRSEEDYRRGFNTTPTRFELDLTSRAFGYGTPASRVTSPWLIVKGDDGSCDPISDIDASVQTPEDFRAYYEQNLGPASIRRSDDGKIVFVQGAGSNGAVLIQGREECTEVGRVLSHLNR